MPTPYWGQLPGPKIHKRLSQPGTADVETGADDAYRHQAPTTDSTPTTSSYHRSQHSQRNLESTEIYGPGETGIDPNSNISSLPVVGSETGAAPDSAQAHSSQPQELPRRRRSKRLQKLPHQHPKMNNRASVQTAVTDSTYDEPDTPGFQPQGLAPRPPSYIRGGASGHQGSSGMQHSNSRRRSRQPEDYDDYGSSTPPIAPEAPRGPPTSYRGPYSNGAAYQYSASGGAGPAPPEASEQYQSRRAEPGMEPSRSHPGAVDVPLNVSAGGTPDRRKVFADDRSPLQRLELTLGSYTKEEKRARVEAAERRARERAALRAGVPPPSTAPQAVVPERRVSSSQQDARPIRREPPEAVATASAPVSHLPLARGTEQPKDVPRSHGSHRRAQPSQSYESRGPARANVDPAQTEQYYETDEAAIPKRNLSFRERAAKDQTELPAPQQEPVYSGQAPASTSGGLSLTRSGSNKLRKHPPGDPWYHQRMEAERAIPSVATRAPQSQPRQDQRDQLRQTSEDDQLPMNPPTDLREEERRTSRGGRTALGAAAAGAAMGAAAQGSRQQAGSQSNEPMSPGYDSDEKYMPTKTKRKDLSHWGYEPPESDQPPPGVEAARRQLEGDDSEHTSDSSLRHEQNAAAYGRPEQMKPGHGRYQSPEWITEWEKATVGRLTGPLLDLDGEPDPDADKNKAWWEDGQGSRRQSSSGRQRRAEAFDGEYDDSNGAPTRFKPPLYLKCGPLIRYCGMRQEQNRNKGASPSEREMWRGSIMIVTHDAQSSYEIAPTLRLFVQDLELLPPPPHHVDGELSPEYVDPIAGHPKLGRRGETLYVRPVEHLQEGKDLSTDESNNGLFETTRSTPDASAAGADANLSGSFTSRRARISADGEKMQKYKDIRGFRLHAERGCTFWRFNIEVELRERQQRIAYRINRGPAMAFWVPPQGQTMNMMFHSCNGFSLAAKPDEFSGPDPMWRDVLNNHQTRPFHVMIGGGDQIYNDCVANETELFGNWLDINNLHHKHQAPFTPDMQDELEDFYLDRYCSWFSQGLFSVATSQIPMVNMFDDHDIFDGYGSYPDSEMSSPVLCGLGAVAFKYYMLFQQQSIIPETEKTEPSLVMGLEPGPYINELSRSLYVSMGAKVSLLAVDARTERTELDVMSSKTWEKIMNRLYAEVRRGHVEHLLVLLGVPIAYPRLVWLENILTSRLLDPVKALGKTGFLGKSLNSIDGGVEVLDDLNDHWTAKNHKHERALVIEDLQDLAIDKSLRITILSGDVHLAAVGQFFSNPKLGLAKHKDPRYMPNIISSAIANAPPPDLMADVLNKRNKVHHFDKQTDEDMIPMFQHGPDGKPRNNKRLLPHRNWCSIRTWNPGSTPPPTPPPEDHERSPSPERSGRGPMALIRRLSSRSRSQSGRQEPSRDSVRGPRPPISGSGGGGFFRSLSRRRGSTSEGQPKTLTRTMSLGRDDAPKKAGFFGSFRRRGSQSRPNDGGINGQWGQESDEEDDYYYGDPRAYGDPRMQTRQQPQPSGLRGGGVQDEYTPGDEDYFTAQPPRRTQTMGSQPAKQDAEFPPTRPFHRTPTGLSTKQKKQADNYEVDLEGGLDICLNVEVNPKDPTGITMPYRLLVPKLFYEYTPGDDDISTLPAEKRASGGRFKKLLSFRRKPAERDYDEDEYSEDDEDWSRR